MGPGYNHAAPVGGIKKWVKLGLDFSDFTDGGGLVGTFIIGTLPIGGMVTGWHWLTTIIYSGSPAVTQALAVVGTVATPDLYSNPVTGRSVHGVAPEASWGQVVSGTSYGQLVTPVDIQLQVTLTGGNWSDLLTGRQDVVVWYMDR